MKLVTPPAIAEPIAAGTMEVTKGCSKNASLPP